MVQLFSPWTEEKKKQKQYLLDRKKMLYEIGARVNNSRENSKDNLSNEDRSDDGKPLHYSQSAHQLGQCETKLLVETKCDRVEEVDDNNASSNMSPTDQ